MFYNIEQTKKFNWRKKIKCYFEKDPSKDIVGMGDIPIRKTQAKNLPKNTIDYRGHFSDASEFCISSTSAVFYKTS